MKRTITSKIPQITKIKGYLTMGEAATKMGISRQAIWHAVARGRLEHTRIEHLVLIPQKAVAAYQKSKGNGGQPKKAA